MWAWKIRRCKRSRAEVIVIIKSGFPDAHHPWPRRQIDQDFRTKMRIFLGFVRMCSDAAPDVVVLRSDRIHIFEGGHAVANADHPLDARRASAVDHGASVFIELRRVQVNVAIDQHQPRAVAATSRTMLQKASARSRFSPSTRPGAADRRPQSSDHRAAEAPRDWCARRSAALANRSTNKAKRSPPLSSPEAVRQAKQTSVRGLRAGDNIFRHLIQVRRFGPHQGHRSSRRTLGH